MHLYRTCKEEGIYFFMVIQLISQPVIGCNLFVFGFLLLSPQPPEHPFPLCLAWLSSTPAPQGRGVSEAASAVERNSKTKQHYVLFFILPCGAVADYQPLNEIIINCFAIVYNFIYLQISKI